MDLTDFINNIIDTTFKVITKVYQKQKESNFSEIEPSYNSLIVFPKTKDDEDDEDKAEDRISEQELRFIFVEQFNKSVENIGNNLFYSIETPTDEFYYFSGESPRCIPKGEHKRKKKNGENGAGRSANIDLVILQKDGKCINRVALIEFKAHNPKTEDYRKDICKLINENSSCLKYFIQIIDNGSDFNDYGKINDNKLEKRKGNTLASIKSKIGKPDELREKTMNIKDDYQITYWCVNLNKHTKVKGTINKDGLEYKLCEPSSTEE